MKINIYLDVLTLQKCVNYKIKKDMNQNNNMKKKLKDLKKNIKINELNKNIIHESSYK